MQISNVYFNNIRRYCEGIEGVYCRVRGGVTREHEEVLRVCSARLAYLSKIFAEAADEAATIRLENAESLKKSTKKSK